MPQSARPHRQPPATPSPINRIPSANAPPSASWRPWVHPCCPVRYSRFPLLVSFLFHRATGLAQRDSGVHAVVDGSVVEPARRDRFRLRIELHDLFAVRPEIAELRTP